MKYLGCAYYPEYWGAARFATDARLMRAAGINLCRIGEFAWSRMEPEEGRFTLDWLHECADVLGKHGINIQMCTPTPTPPAWLTTAYPDVLLVRADGVRLMHGHRRHYCTTSDTYRRHSARITTKLAEEMSKHKNVVAWQLDNELGPEAGWCHCENCQSRFQAWLQARYGTVAELNRAWKTGFWSVDFSDWRQVRLEDGRIEMYSSQKLDSRRFWSEMTIDFARSQTAILRRLHQGAIISTNGMGPIHTPIDYYKLFSELDVACDDLYFDIGSMDTDVLAMNVYRSIKPGQRYWITETGSGALDHGKPPHPDQFRAWAWSSWAHGADAHFIFRWRTCLSGHEQELQGILEHTGKPRHRYAAVKACFQEIAGLREELADLPLPEVKVAIVQDYEVLWGYESSRVGRDIDYLGTIYRLHNELYDRNVLADVIPPDRDLARYRLVVLPSLMMIREEFAERLAAYVKQGGTVLALGQIGMRDFNDNYLTDAGPQHLRRLLGVSIEGGMYLHSCVDPDEALWVPKANRGQVEIPVSGLLAGEKADGVAKVWAADTVLKGGQALLGFAGDAYAGQPAVVEKTTGKGLALYVGAASVDEPLYRRILDYILAKAGVEPGVETPRHVEVVRRGDVVFVINHTAQAADVKLDVKGEALVGVYSKGVARLPAYGVTVVRRT